MYQAAQHNRSKQLGSPLSKDLQKKYGRRNVRVVVGDTVKVLRGEFKDIDGKVSKISTQDYKIAIEGIKKEKGKGDKFDVMIHSSNVLVTGLNTADSWRTSKLEGKKVKNQPRAETKPETPKKPAPQKENNTKSMAKKEEKSE